MTVTFQHVSKQTGYLQYQLIAIEQLDVGQYQPRRCFNEKTLQELAQSIRMQGLIEPILVREVTSNRFEIIAGERRYRAAILAQLSEVPCLVGSYNDEEAATLAIVENVQREDLNPLEEASAYQRLWQEFQFTQEDIAHMVGKSRSHIANTVRLLNLCSPVQALLKESRLTMGHAKVLLGLDPNTQLALAEETCRRNWSVRILEEKTKQKKDVIPSSTSFSPSDDISHLQTAISEQIGAPVQIVCDSTQSGWLKIKFFDNETLLGLLERMGLRYD